MGQDPLARFAADKTEDDIMDDMEMMIYQGINSNIWSFQSSPDVVVKEILIDNMSHAADRQLQDRIDALIEMDHPNLLRYKFGTKQEKFLYLLMQYYPTSLGQTIRSYRVKKKKWPADKVRNIACQLAGAIAYLHTFERVNSQGKRVRGIVHGGLHPMNILVDSTGQNFLVADAGISSGKLYRQTKMYIAPEVLEGVRVNFASDMWSLGIVLYEMVTGVQPDATTQHELNMHLIDDGLIRNAIAKLLIPDPSKRISAEGLVQLLTGNDIYLPAHVLTLFSQIELDIADVQKQIDELADTTTAHFDNHANLSPLMIAVKKGDMNTLVSLTKDKSNTCLKDQVGMTALIHAVVAHQYEAINILAPMESSLTDKYGMTALMYAACINDPKAVDLLAFYEAEKADRDSSLDGTGNGTTALMHTVTHNSYEAAQKLVAYETCCKNINGETALMIAANNNNARMVKILASHEIGMQDKDGFTALMIAARSGHSDIIELLIYETGIQNAGGYTALMIAAAYGHTNVAKTLSVYEKGIRNRWMSTALISAAYSNHPSILELLIPDECGLANRFGLTAMMEAAKHGRTKIVEMLVQYEKGKKDYEGRTALFFAQKFNHYDIVEILSRYSEERNS